MFEPFKSIHPGIRHHDIHLQVQIHHLGDPFSKHSVQLGFLRKRKWRWTGHYCCRRVQSRRVNKSCFNKGLVAHNPAPPAGEGQHMGRDGDEEGSMETRTHTHTHSNTNTHKPHTTAVACFLSPRRVQQEHRGVLGSRAKRGRKGEEDGRGRRRSGGRRMGAHARGGGEKEEQRKIVMRLMGGRKYHRYISWYH